MRELLLHKFHFNDFNWSYWKSSITVSILDIVENIFYILKHILQLETYTK